MESLKPTAVRSDGNFRNSDKSMSSETDGSRTRVEINNLSDWLLLDCMFGVPLFDADINERICDAIVNQLAEKESLEKLTVSNQELGELLKQFIEDFQDLDKNRAASKSLVGMPLPQQKEVPWPASNLMFFEGELKEWNRKW